MTVQLVTDREVLQTEVFNSFEEFKDYLISMQTGKMKTYKCGNDAYYIDFGSSEQYLLIREEEL